MGDSQGKRLFFNGKLGRVGSRLMINTHTRRFCPAVILKSGAYGFAPAAKNMIRLSDALCLSLI